jgi:hypothetical protein
MLIEISSPGPNLVAGGLLGLGPMFISPTAGHTAWLGALTPAHEPGLLTPLLG